MPGRKSYRGGAVQTTLATALAATGETQIIVVASTGWPDGAGSQPYVLVIDPGQTTEEKVLCASRTNQTHTITTRGYDASTMAAHAVGAVVSHVLDADTIDEANAHVNDDSRDDHSQYIKTDGTRAFTALTAVGGTPVAVGTTIAVGTANTLARSDHVHSLAANAVVTASIANLAVTKAKIETEQQFPAGVIMDYGGAAAPSGWVLCDGTSYATSAHPDLFGAIGYVYGGSGLNFSVPDFTGRVAAMKSASGTFSVLGETGGVSAVTLVTANLPSHTHTINHDHAAQNTGAGTSHTHTIDAGGGDLVYTATSTLGLVNTGIAQTVSYNDANVTNSAESAHTHPVDIAAFTGSSSATGSATAVNALPPYLVINKIIKL